MNDQELSIEKEILLFSANHASIFSLILMLILLLTGCVGNTLREVTCWSQLRGLPVADSRQRIEYGAFSILPPAGENWCATEQSSFEIRFETTGHMGQFIDPPNNYFELMDYYTSYQSYTVSAYQFKARDTRFSTPETIKEFLEKWYEAGHSMITSDSDLYADLIVEDAASRFELISLSVFADSSYDADCVRYIANANERGPMGDYLLLMNYNEEGYTCRHPESSELLVTVSFIERFYRDGADPKLTRKRRAEADQMLQSLQFSELR